jgi:peptidoglycan/xylan/chitin deacetylase (PgdA/CDA1 family)
VAEWEKMKARKPVASLSLDLDNKWSYMKTHGDPRWESFPSYLDVLVPRVLNFLEQRNLIITFFIVGQDAALDKNHNLLRSIAAAGHEIANHSFHHEPWLHLYREKEIEADLTLAEEHIERATGERPVGFRAPGYSLTPTVLGILGRRSYQYDATTLPSLVAPLVRAYYFTTARFTPEQRRQRKVLGGTFRDGLRPIRQYRWQMDNGTLIEIPVTTMPIFKIPIHVSYLMGLSVFARNLALQYFNAGLKLCQLTGTQPSLVLHPTDFLGCDDTQDLSFIPGMSLPRERKLEFVSEVLRRLPAEFTVVTLQQHAREAARLSDLPVVTPRSPKAMSQQQQSV